MVCVDVVAASAGSEDESGPEAAPDRFTMLPLPTIDVAPETSLAIGAVALMTFRPFEGVRPSQAEVEVTGTLRRQAIFAAETDLFLPEDRGLVSVRGAVMRFPELYWGIGPDTPPSADTERVYPRR